MAILEWNKPAAYPVPAPTYEALMHRLEDLELGRLVRERESEKSQAVMVALDDL